jgi:hypothetical protein
MGPLAIGYVFHEEHDVVTNYFFPGEEHEIDPWISHWKASRGTLFAEVFYPRTAALDGEAEVDYGSLPPFVPLEPVKLVAPPVKLKGTGKPRKGLTVLQIEALQFLFDFSERTRKDFSRSFPGHVFNDPYWSTLENSYMWSTKHKVNFTPQTLRSLVNRGFVETKPGYDNHFRITAAGRETLAKAKEG